MKNAALLEVVNIMLERAVPAFGPFRCWTQKINLKAQAEKEDVSSPPAQCGPKRKLSHRELLQPRGSKQVLFPPGKWPQQIAKVARAGGGSMGTPLRGDGRALAQTSASSALCGGGMMGEG